MGFQVCGLLALANDSVGAYAKEIVIGVITSVISSLLLTALRVRKDRSRAVDGISVITAAAGIISVVMGALLAILCFRASPISPAYLDLIISGHDALGKPPSPVAMLFSGAVAVCLGMIGTVAMFRWACDQLRG